MRKTSGDMGFGAREKCPNMSTRSTPLVNSNLAGIFTLPQLIIVPLEHVSTSTDENGKVSFFIWTSSPSYQIPTAFTWEKAPSKPLPPSLVTAETSTLHLVWDPRDSDVEFTLQMNQRTPERCQSFLPVYNGSKAKFTVTGLQRDSKFHFRLKALNGAGSSEYSEEVSFSTMPDLPNAPMRPCTKGAIQTDSFVVAWTAPVDDGGSNIISFRLELNDGTGWTPKYCGIGQEFVLKDLQPSLEYRVRVSAETHGGVGPFSETLNVTTAPVKAALVPGKPFPPNFKQDGTRVSLSWKSTDDNVNLESSYMIEFAKLERKGDLVWEVVYNGKALSTEINNLDPDTQYLIRLSAFNSVGRSEISCNVSLKTTRQSNGGKDVEQSYENTKKVGTRYGATTALEGVNTLALAEKSIRIKARTVTREPKFKSHISTTSTSSTMASLVPNTKEIVLEKQRNSCPTFSTIFVEPSMVISGPSDKRVDVKAESKADTVTAKKRMNKERNNKCKTELTGPHLASHISKRLMFLLLCAPLIQATQSIFPVNEVAQNIFHVKQNGDFNITRSEIEGCHYWVHNGMEEAGNADRRCCYSVYENSKHCLPSMQEENCRTVSESLNGSDREIMLGDAWSDVKLKIPNLVPGDAGIYMCYNNQDNPKYKMQLKMGPIPKDAQLASNAPIITIASIAIIIAIIAIIIIIIACWFKQDKRQNMEPVSALVNCEMNEDVRTIECDIVNRLLPEVQVESAESV